MLSLGTNENRIAREEACFKKGHVLSELHSKITTIYFLQNGELEYFITDEVTGEHTPLLRTSDKNTIIGWEVVNPPQRAMVSVRITSEEAVLLSQTKDQFLASCDISKLRMVCSNCQNLLESTFSRQIDLLSNRVRQKAVQLENYYISQQATLSERKLLLKSSPFFTDFGDEEITGLASRMVRREYEPNDLIYDQGQDPEGLFILIQGEISMRRMEGSKYLDLRSISTPGYVFGWSSTFSEKDICRATSYHKSSVYFIDRPSLNELIDHPVFGVEFYSMLIWLIENQLQMSFSRYLHLLADHNLISVKHLIDINRPRIPLPSPLHQIPHLLGDTSTHELAFTALHQLSKKGSKQERHLSSICLDILKTEEREMIFLNRIAGVYNTVSRGAVEQPAQNRKACAEKAREVFDSLDYHLEGTEHLPNRSGHIFIYNHLINHPQYTLNNSFQLTLDSHFISSVILDMHYDDPGIRTVRIGENAEYGHQDYYDKLGYQKVYTQGKDLHDQKSRERAKAKFYEEAEAYLNGGANLIISPEGTSYLTEESPGPFKMGPFNLATAAKEEPLLVPVVFVHFDKRIHEALFFCRILKPFRISEKRKENQPLKAFVNEYQQEFAKEVTAAIDSADLLFAEQNN